MIRTGYLRWEIEATDARCDRDQDAREVRFLARPSYRTVRVKNPGQERAAEAFARGEEAYESLVRHRDRPDHFLDLTIPDVGPLHFRYTAADREKNLRYWLAKLQREVSSFAHEVVRAASAFPQLVISSAALRAGYARMVEQEVFRVIDGRSAPAPTNDAEPMPIDGAQFARGVPELVAAELVRDVVEPAEFEEFCRFDRVTVRHGDRHYRIPRRPHALIEVWNAQTLRGEAQLCVIFQDPGMPPSDEVVMKYLLAKHQPDLLWQVGVRFAPPMGKFDGAPPRRWKSGT